MIDQSNKKDYQGPLYARHPDLVKRTQNKENYYYWFWIIAMVAVSYTHLTLPTICSV